MNTTDTDKVRGPWTLTAERHIGYIKLGVIDTCNQRDS